MMEHPGECSLKAGACPAAEMSVAEVLQRLDREALRGTCDTGRYRCSYFAWGAGPPLVFIPGLSSDARSFALVMAHLVGDFRCISYDLPTGHGDGANLARYTHEHLAADPCALLDHLGERQGHIFGFSFGATIVLRAMHARPERWRRAALQSGFARRTVAPAEVGLARLAAHWQAPLGRAPLLNAVLRRNHQRWFAGRPPEVWRFFVQRFGTTPIAAVARRALLVHNLDLRPLLPNIRQPILLVRGDGDPVIDSACADDLRTGLPNAAEVELPDCGHHALFTHPAELAALVRQFLAGPTACPMPGISPTR